MKYWRGLESYIRFLGGVGPLAILSYQVVSRGQTNYAPAAYRLSQAPVISAGCKLQLYGKRLELAKVDKRLARNWSGHARLAITMESRNDRLYGENDVYRKNVKKITPFLHPVMERLLKENCGKSILDIGCGPGQWSRLAAECGAKSVDGFDIQEKMVEAAKQTTSQFNNVNIKLGDVRSMPYDENTFDLALSIYITCSLPKDALVKHYQELYRVLAPGGKAILVNLKNTIYQGLRVSHEADSSFVQKSIGKALSGIPKYPTEQQILDLCNGLGAANVEVACFSLDKNGSMFHVTDIRQLTIGQEVWIKFHCVTFPDYFYEEQYLVDQATTSGLRLDKEENYTSEKVRVAHNKEHPDVTFAKIDVEDPIACMYYLSKPL